MELTCGHCCKVPPPGEKLRTCSGCMSTKFCTTACQRAAWAAGHKLVCKSLRDVHAGAMAQVESIAPGSAKQAMKERADPAYWVDWYERTPGLKFKAMFIAWKHRAEYPIIRVAIHSDRLDEVPEIVVVPKTEWSTGVVRDNSDTAMNAKAHAHFGNQNFGVDKTYLVRLVVTFPNSPKLGLAMGTKFHMMTHVHSSVLTDLTADEFAAEMIRRREDGDGHPTVYVRLTGLRGAAHLNGQEGVRLGRDPNDPERMTIRLDGGREVGVLSKNYEKVHRPKLLKYEFRSLLESESDDDDEFGYDTESE
mmetsp:Transcript_23411/g.37537  ORF Transcript_23411/g.37537 Transcript_23411/m.37537 type:complete len:306 (-) Transcript_23411:712-1629(-)